MSAPELVGAPSESELIARARSASGAEREEACRALYESLRGRVFRVCLHLCGERTLAEDAMQNAFFAAFRGLGSFRGEALLSTWIYRVAIREALQLRGARPAPTEPPEAAAHLASRDAAPDAQLDVRRRAQATREAFRKLSAEHQAVLSLFAVEGLRHRQIAEVLGVAEGTVWSRLHDARKALEALLDGE